MRQQTFDIDGEVHYNWRERQDNIVLRHLDAIKGDRALLKGFTSTLTDALAMWWHIGDPNRDYYDGLVTDPAG